MIGLVDEERSEAEPDPESQHHHVIFDYIDNDDLEGVKKCVEEDQMVLRDQVNINICYLFNIILLLCMQQFQEN